jgi:hypothetical protein
MISTFGRKARELIAHMKLGGKSLRTTDKKATEIPVEPDD